MYSVDVTFPRSRLLIKIGNYQYVSVEELVLLWTTLSSLQIAAVLVNSVNPNGICITPTMNLSLIVLG